MKIHYFVLTILSLTLSMASAQTSGSHEPIVESPEPINGFSAFVTYINNNLVYPEKAKSEKLEGKVFVEFMVETDGSVGKIQVLKGISPECNEEAMRLIRDGGLWKPGKSDGQLKSTKMVLPINFRLSQ